MTNRPKTQQTDRTFAIIGGGIAGLTTAIALKGLGIRSAVFEASPVMEPVGAGITLAFNALKALKYLGIYDRVASAGQLFHRMTIYDKQGRVINRMDTRVIEGAVNLAIHRADLHRSLLAELEPENIFTGKRSAAIRKVADGYEVDFEDSTQLHAENVIVAEGIHSVIRNEIIPDARIRYAGYTCWRGITGNNLNIREPSETWGPEGRFGMVPVGDNKVYWFACKKAPENSALMKDYGTKELCREFKEYHSPIGELIRATPPDQIIWNDIIDLEPVARYAFDNLLLVGDAAHATTPNMGQGACLAIEDAVVLRECLRQNSLINEAFRCFERKRLKRTHAIVKQSWRLGKVAQWENIKLGGLRNAIFRILPQFIYRHQLEKVYNFRTGGEQ